MSDMSPHPDLDRTRAELDHLRVTQQRDLHRMWELLMWPLGFTARSLWVTFVDTDGRPLQALVEIGELDDLGGDPGAEPDVAPLFHVLDQVLGDGPAVSVAFLVVRPGRAGLQAEDRRLAAALLAGARRAGIHCHPVHVADDVRLAAVTPDDLAA